VRFIKKKGYSSVTIIGLFCRNIQVASPDNPEHVLAQIESQYRSEVQFSPPKKSKIEFIDAMSPLLKEIENAKEKIRIAEAEAEALKQSLEEGKPITEESELIRKELEQRIQGATLEKETAEASAETTLADYIYVDPFQDPPRKLDGAFAATAVEQAAKPSDEEETFGGKRKRRTLKKRYTKKHKRYSRKRKTRLRKKR
jgi:hypothetical protein